MRAVKNILLITHGFYPEQSPRSFRVTELSKELCRQGHIVTVMAPYREGSETYASDNGFTYISLGTLYWANWNTERFGGVSIFVQKLFRRLFDLLFNYPSMELFFKVKHILKKHKAKYDVLISVAVPHSIHWGVAACWRKGGEDVAEVWIADCGDPFCLQENDTYKPLFYFHFIEKWFMRKSDFVTVPTVDSFNGYFPEFHSKLRIIPQGFRFEDVVRRDNIVDGVIRFGYGGVFIPGKRDPTAFIIYCRSLPKSIKFEFHIYTSSAKLLERFKGIDSRILFHPPVNRLELLENFSTYNFVVNFANTGVVQTPSKLIDYAILEKPILNIKNSEFNTKIVRKFLAGDYSGSLRIENIENYKIENVAAEFLKLL